MLAPTRELAIQIHHDAEVLGKYTGLKLGLAYGGTGYEQQRQTIEAGIDVLIGTPGRIIDYFKQHVFDLKKIEVMVLDEADRMFDLGFIKDIRYLLHRMPPPEQRLNLLFSATLSHRVLELAYEHMNNAETINVTPATRTADKVSQVVYHTANEEKIPLLIGILRKKDPKRTMVFINTKHVAERVCAWMNENGLSAEVISGDVPQTKRQRLLTKFSEGELPVLVATDVAARGLHIPDVSHVINYDLPQDAEDYVHRIGRTARAGASGDAISFACETYAYHLMDIEEYIGHKIPVQGVADTLLATDLKAPAPIPRKSRDGRGGRPGSGRRDGGRGQGQRGGPRRDSKRPARQSSAETKPAVAHSSEQKKKKPSGGSPPRGSSSGPALG